MHVSSYLYKLTRTRTRAYVLLVLIVLVSSIPSFTLRWNWIFALPRDREGEGLFPLGRLERRLTTLLPTHVILNLE